MSIYFAEVAGRPAFFDQDLHGDAIPAGAVQITRARHAQLLDAQAQGKAITVGAKGKPEVFDSAPSISDHRAQLRAAIKREAARRIDRVSPLWRQLNDTRHPTEAGAARFAKIDVIRAASDRIEGELKGMTDEQLRSADLCGSDYRNNSYWTEIS